MMCKGLTVGSVPEFWTGINTTFTSETLTLRGQVEGSSRLVVISLAPICPIRHSLLLLVGWLFTVQISLSDAHRLLYKNNSRALAEFCMENSQFTSDFQLNCRPAVVMGLYTQGLFTR